MPHVASRLRIVISSAEGVRASVGNLTISSSLCRLGRSTGNAHTRNLLTDHGRVVLLDFESSAIGPREWDLLDLLPTAIATDRYGLPLSTTSSSRRPTASMAAHGRDIRCCGRFVN